ncbi:hypothetical protein I6N95_22125 [Vagococcus sp. BWB3-3]|uniref:LPXTG cell wall anchor domain-containing protein n=1 Tax=Vagococcus allomyrinae TaxID=2794353 RepID=A0A940P9X8_9ENTE|nr:hypothetical protein [Vagococcus allomyrinae]MBP1043730.1 hypothetical protein [Vagococcus allomyrinae]
MKKFRVICLFSVSLLIGFVPNTFATTEESSTPLVATPAETQVKDITAYFEIPNMENIAVDSEGDIKVKPLEGIEDTSGKILATVKDNDVITIDENGHWKALKEGKTTITLTYSYSESTMNELKSKYPNYEFSQREIATLVNVSVVNSIGAMLDITPKFIVDDLSDLKLNDTGVISVEPIEGVEVTGKFLAQSPANGVVSFDETGKWIALKPGTATIPILFEYSQDTMDRLEEKFPNTTFVTKEIAELAIFNVFDGAYALRAYVSNQDINAKVGDTGKFTIDPIGGIADLTGIYEISDPNGIIEVDKDGNWKALKSGKTVIGMNVRLTEESIARIRENNPFKKETPSTMEARSINVTVTDKTTNDDNTKANDQAKKELPQTSNDTDSRPLLLGIALIGLTLFKLYQKTFSKTDSIH